jgi:hypothetical protein
LRGRLSIAAERGQQQDFYGQSRITGDHTLDVSTDKATESQEDNSKNVSTDKATESQEDHTKQVSTDKATESREDVTTCTTEEHLIDGSQDAAGSTSKDTSAISGQVVAIKSQDQDSPSSGPGKRGIDEIGPALSRHAAEMKNRGPKFPVAGTVDEDEPMDSEMFESRQQFLNYCQTNHCQFDELRRTKHSTMMVLFQLHNPMAPLVLKISVALVIATLHTEYDIIATIVPTLIYAKSATSP